jgi:hypothetical protein
MPLGPAGYMLIGAKARITPFSAEVSRSIVLEGDSIQPLSSVLKRGVSDTDNASAPRSPDGSGREYGEDQITWRIDRRGLRHRTAHSDRVHIRPKKCDAVGAQCEVVLENRARFALKIAAEIVHQKLSDFAARHRFAFAFWGRERRIRSTIAAGAAPGLCNRHLPRGFRRCESGTGCSPEPAVTRKRRPASEMR